MKFSGSAKILFCKEYVVLKNKLLIMLCVATIVLSGCAKEDNNTSEAFDSSDTQIKEEVDIDSNVIDEDTSVTDEALYIGEYLDYDCNEPNLEIAKGSDGKYIVQIGIFRLTTLDDGIGELTPEGLSFTATDAAGNPISGIITVEEQIATVTFTDSTWALLENGTTYLYTKSSDEPTIWSE
jgi:hypothetical protein